MENMNKIDEWSSKNYRRIKDQKIHGKQVYDYVAWSDKTQEQLIDEGHKGSNERVACRLITDYKAFLDDKRIQDQENGPSEITVNAIISAIRSFYRYYGVLTKFSRNELPIPVAKYVDHRFSIAELNGMLHTMTSLRNKSLLLCALSSGIREGDLRQLPRKRIESLLDQEAPVCIGPLTTEKCRVKAYPFLTKIAIDYLKRYLSSRTDKVDLLFVTDEGQALQGDYMDRSLKLAYTHAGFKQETGTRIRWHSLRKYTISRMQDAGIEESIWKTLIGKSTKESMYTTENLKEHFVKVMDKLDPEAIVNTYKKSEEINDELQNLKNENAELKLRLSELEKRKGIEVLMELYQKQQESINKEAFASSQEASASLNGHATEVKPIIINGAEILTLKALAQSFQKLYDDQKRT
jgi:site-specific recombinase XerD